MAPERRPRSNPDTIQIPHPQPRQRQAQPPLRLQHHRTVTWHGHDSGGVTWPKSKLKKDGGCRQKATRLRNFTLCVIRLNTISWQAIYRRLCHTLQSSLPSTSMFTFRTWLYQPSVTAFVYVPHLGWHPYPWCPLHHCAPIVYVRDHPIYRNDRLLT